MQQKFVFDVPDEIWEQIISLLNHDRYLERLSLVSKRFLSITNRFKQTLIISDPIIHYLPNLFHRFPNLKHISFNKFHGSLTSVMGQISQTHFSLESLDLSKLKNFPSEEIRVLSSSCLSSIRFLKLSNLNVISDIDLGVISHLMGNLEELDLSDPKYDYSEIVYLDTLDGYWGITDNGVDLLASKLRNLRKVNLSGNYMISNKSVVSLSEKCPNLEEIGLQNCHFVTWAGVSFALRSCRNLNSLARLGMNLALQEIRDSLSCARNMTQIDFSYMSVSNELLFAIAKASIPLRKFALLHCYNFNFSAVLSLLYSYQSLEYFAMEDVCWLNDQNIDDISKFLHKVNTLKFNLCSRLTSSAFFTILKNCPSLCSLEMKKTNIGKQGFDVSNSNNLQIKALNLGSNKTLSNDCLEKIALSCPNLEQINVSRCQGITRKGIQEIVTFCTGLRHLEINGCEAIKSLGIDTEVCKLERLQASMSGLNDDGLTVIAKKCPALMYLDVMDCSGVTSRGVNEVVKHCERLRELSLNMCCDMCHDIVA